MSRRPRDDAGAALIVALAFLTVISVGALALLTLADTGLRTTQAIRAQGFELYSANGGIDQAITQVRGDLTLGRQAGPCPTTTMALNGVETVVECEGMPGSGVGGPGGAVNENNTPPNAILSLASPELGIEQDGNDSGGLQPLRIDGNVVSNSDIRVSPGSSLVVSNGTVSAVGNCDKDRITPEPNCPAAAPIPNSTDPKWPMDAARPALPTAPASDPQGCPAGGGARLVVFSPGTYRSAAALNDIFNRCAKSVFWFQSGFYYFDFDDGATTTWTITDRETQVVGGERENWVPESPAAGNARPVVPFPVTTAAGTTAGGCTPSSSVGAAAGVQFAFGGRSRLLINDASVELCAPAHTNAQQIAIYGIDSHETESSTAQVPRVLTGTGVTRTPDNDVDGFKDPSGVLSSGGTAAVFTATAAKGKDKNQSAQLSVPFGALSGVPAGSKIDDVRLHIVHRPVNSNVKELSAVVRLGDGTPVSVPAKDKNCDLTKHLCWAESVDMYDQRISLNPLPTSIAALQNVTVDFTASVTFTEGTPGRPEVAGEERVDLIELEVLYTPPSYRRLMGCTTISIEAGGCPLLQTAGSPTRLAVHGTAYAPTAALDIELTNASTSVLGRGVVARSLRLTITGSSTFTGSAISLPQLGGGGRTNREVRFTAKQGGVPVLRAVVSFDDRTTAGGTAAVASWSVLR